MSMPKFPESNTVTREDAVNQILSSIAMEELALSHILNAEGEKLQYILGTLDGIESPEATIEQVLEANESVQKLLESVAYNQMFLKGKMSAALSSAKEDAPNPPYSQGDILVAVGAGAWEFQHLELNIPFENNLYSQGNAMRHTANSAEFTILKSGEYQIDYTIAADNPAVVEELPIDITIRLISNLSGVLDSVHVTDNRKQLIQRRVIAELDVGEVLYLQASQPELSEMTVSSPVMVITKLN